MLTNGEVAEGRHNRRWKTLERREGELGIPPHGISTLSRRLFYSSRSVDWLRFVCLRYLFPFYRGRLGGKLHDGSPTREYLVA